MLIDTDKLPTIACVIDYPPKRMYSESSDLFNFWEVTDNISETVQNKDAVAVED